MYRIGIDLDGVLYNYIAGYNAIALEQFGLHLPAYNRENYPIKWDWMQDLVTKEQDNVIRKITYTSETFWQDLPSYPWAKNLGYYLSCSDEIYFITSRTGKRVKYQSEAALQELCISSPTVLIVPFAKDKPYLVNALNLDIMIEDKPETLSLLHFSCPHTTIYRFVQPWNKECIGQYLYDFEEFFIKLYQGK